MVEITQRKEVRFWMNVHGSSLEGIPRGPSELSGKARPNRWEIEPVSTTGHSIFGSAERPGKIFRLKLHSFGNQLHCCFREGRSFGDQLILRSLTIGHGSELGKFLHIREFAIVEIDLL